LQSDEARATKFRSFSLPSQSDRAVINRHDIGTPNGRRSRGAYVVAVSVLEVCLRVRRHCEDFDAPAQTLATAQRRIRSYFCGTSSPGAVSGWPCGKRSTSTSAAGGGRDPSIGANAVLVGLQAADSGQLLRQKHRPGAAVRNFKATALCDV
jgi:hypothetical protein